jgi:hypothetical protein
MNDTNPQDPQQESKPKIIVDEGWKEQVQAEKQKLKKETGAGAEQTDGGPPPTEQEIPEASFPMLVTTLATQATVALGQAAPPDATEVTVDLAMAKHLIDTLGVLEEKTKGNLTSDEAGMLSGVLHQLRMIFVAVQGQVTGKPDPKSSIELP